MKLSLPKINKDRFKSSFKSGFAKGSGYSAGLKKSAVSKLHLKKVTRKDKVLAAVSYLFLGGLIVSFFNKDRDQFLKFHIRQSIVLFVIFTFILFIPEFGFTIFGPLVALLMLVNLVVSAFGGTLKLMPR
jgi:uncharacterized membrane protein